MLELLKRQFSASDIENAFRDIGIHQLSPGFYDAPAFLRAEQQEPRLLELYAAYVKCRPYTEDYLRRACEMIRSAAAFLSDRLTKDGRKGACIDASGILGRFLEKEGIWNFVAKGGLTTAFPKSSGVPRGHFAPIHNTPGLAAGHAWLVAPPFEIVDITLRQQPYSYGEERFLPAMLLVTKVEPAVSEAADWIDPELYPSLIAEFGRMPDMRLVERMVGLEGMASAKRLGTCQVEQDGITFKYIATGLTAGDAPLEKAQNLILSGITPIDLYREWTATRGKV